MCMSSNEIYAYYNWRAGASQPGRTTGTIFLYNWRAKRAYLRFIMGRRTFYICACVKLFHVKWFKGHRLAPRSRQRFASERQQCVVNTTGRFAELATNVKHSSSYYVCMPYGGSPHTVSVLMFLRDSEFTRRST